MVATKVGVVLAAADPALARPPASPLTFGVVPPGDPTEPALPLPPPKLGDPWGPSCGEPFPPFCFARLIRKHIASSPKRNISCL